MVAQLRGRTCFTAGVVALMLFLAPRLDAQGSTGSVRGVVRQTGTSAPLANAEVTVTGSRLGALSRNDGSYVITNVPAGAHRVHVRLFGFSPNEQSVTVTADASATVDFVLSPTAVQLDQVVVTGTAGQARRREVGNAISAVQASETPEVKTDVSSLLQGRIAGASVQLSTGSTGAGASIRLRGNTSVALSNQPLIYVDGVRTRSDEYPKNVPPAGSNLRSTNYYASPLNDINPEDIDRIEVLKGAAATTLYGTEAAAGVIQIFTKRGTIGTPSWNFETTQGFNRERPFGLDAVDPTDTTANSCSTRFGQRNCAEYLYMNPWLRNGIKSDYNLSVNGGAANGTRYFLSGGFDDNQGVMPLDEERKYGVRANFTFAPTQTLTFDWNSSYTNNHISNTPAGNNAAGLTLNAFRRNRNYYGSANIDTISQVLQYQLNTWINRMILGGTMNYAPFAGMTNKLTVGIDRANVENRNLRPFGFPESPTGTLSEEQWANQVLTTDYVGSFEHEIRGLMSTFAWGGQASLNDLRDVQAYTIGFGGPGDPTISTGSQWNGTESRVRILTGGLFLQEMIGWRDRLFVTGGARFDKYSAFGKNIGVQPYPKISASYVISDESFWQSSALNRIASTMKLRAAYGQAGRAPGAFDYLRSYDAVGWGGQPALRTRNLGNPDLGPERSAETEVGFESSSLSGRLGIDLTYYRTRTTDALINLTPPPSGGFLNPQLENIGTLDKRGLELAINTTPFQHEKLTWTLGSTIALNKNRVLSLGGAAPFNVSPGGNGNGFAMEGQPLAVLRGRYITNADAIADPIVEQNHLFGPSQPTRIIGVTSALHFPKGIELSARAEYQGGNYLDEDASYQALSRAVRWPTCFDAYAKQAADGNQNNWTARERATCNSSQVRQDEFIFKADFAKLRDVTLRAPVPQRLVPGTRSASISVSVQNWFTWKNKNFRLFDPEMAGNDGFNATVRYISEQIPAPATVVARLQIQF
ncbi:MAG TPA: SusC/RagA family TonB-linked outer membrane protein [Gemmatimonadaceae bacterium]|jgi:TonB-linked SusC/RagA family outer membrane protein